METTSKNTGFLSEILTSYDENETHGLMNMINLVGDKTMELKVQMRDMIKETYADFTSLPHEQEGMLAEAESLSSEIAHLTERIEENTKRNLCNSTSELKNLSLSLQEITITTGIVNQLVELDTIFNLINKLQADKRYCKMAKELRRVQEVLVECVKENPDLKLFQAMTVETLAMSDSFLEKMLSTWAECIHFEEEDERLSLSIVLDRDELTEAVQSLHFLNHLDAYVEKFARRLMCSILLPIIVHGTSVTANDPVGFYATLDVNAANPEQKSVYSVVYKNLATAIRFVHECLNVIVEEDITLVNKIGGIISDELCEELIENCLAEKIPKHSKQLDDFNTIILETKQLETELKDYGFLGADHTRLQDYTQNVEYLCANKTCYSLLEKAREIMKKDLYDMTSAGTDSDTREDLSAFIFPLCKISKSADELLTLVHEVLEDCAASTDMCAVRLFYTARNIVELYGAVVPVHHQQFLDTIPQQAALFHNNCMYLSHCLLTLGHDHRPRLPDVLRSHTATFIDQVNELRRIGSTVFLRHVRTQRNTLLEIVQKSGLDSETSEQTVRQCLRQLELLQSVWQHVLPDNVYCKTIGCLLNACVGDLISKVMSVEDIPADVAAQLVVAFSVVTGRATKILPEPKEVHRHVSQWGRFQELTLILGASMREISDRWSQGQGVSAMHFQPEQMKQLIRALFQNTERRAAILATIK